MSPGMALFTTLLGMTLNLCPSRFPHLVRTVLETEQYTSCALGERSAKGARRPALFCFLPAALETQAFRHTKHTRQGLFYANKCRLLIAGTPFHAGVLSNGRWLAAALSKLPACHQQVLPVAAGWLTHTCASAHARGRLWFCQPCGFLK